VIDLGGGCRRHRPALVDFVDRGEIRPETAPALAHLDRCDRCTTELESTVLTITALRRLGDESSRVEPAGDAWPRLRARLDRWRPSRWAPLMSPTAGLVMSLGLVAVLVAPIRIDGSGQRRAEVDAATDRSRAALMDRRVEARYISTMSRKGTFPDSTLAVWPSGSYPRIYPDDIRPERKEVNPVAPSVRPIEAS
jgi:hypothetical protein